MRHSRILATLAGLATVSLALTGCGGSNSASSSSENDGDITLTVATFNEFGYEDLYSEYEASHPGIKIQQKKAATSNEARENMNTRLAAGSGLSDIEAIEVDWLPELMQYPDQFMDLTSDDVAGRWLDWKVAAATTSDGKLIGYGTDIGPEAICYRADLFKKAGLPTDREEVADLLEGDWDNYFSVGQKFTNATGIPWFDGAQAIYMGMRDQIANPFENSDDTPIPLDKNTEIKSVYDQVLKASVDDNLSAHLTQWSDDWNNAFQNDGFATMLCPGWMLGVIEGNAAGVEGWDIANVFPGGGGNWGGSYLTVPTQGDHQEQARELAAWLTAPEQQIRAFKSKGTFPSQVEALKSDELLSATNSFFNDAPTGKILADRAAAVEVQPFKGTNFFAISDVVSNAITRVDVDESDDAASSWNKAIQAYNDLGLE